MKSTRPWSTTAPESGAGVGAGTGLAGLDTSFSNRDFAGAETSAGTGIEGDSGSLPPPDSTSLARSWAIASDRSTTQSIPRKMISTVTGQMNWSIASCSCSMMSLPFVEGFGVALEGPIACAGHPPPWTLRPFGAGEDPMAELGCPADLRGYHPGEGAQQGGPVLDHLACMLAVERPRLPQVPSYIGHRLRRGADQAHSGVTAVEDRIGNIADPHPAGAEGKRQALGSFLAPGFIIGGHQGSYHFLDQSRGQHVGEEHGGELRGSLHGGLVLPGLRHIQG